MIFGWFGRNRKKESAALYAAVCAGDIAGIRDALQGKADINAIEPESGQAPLHAAVEQSQQAVVELLLAKGANPNIVSTGHATPLMIAAGLGDSALPLVPWANCLNPALSAGLMEMTQPDSPKSRTQKYHLEEISL
jgi:hypothetical protein